MGEAGSCLHRLSTPPPWLRSPLGLVACIAYVFLAISWKMTGAQFALYLLPVSGPVSLLEVDIGSLPGRRCGGSWL